MRKVGILESIDLKHEKDLSRHLLELIHIPYLQIDECAHSITAYQI